MLSFPADTTVPIKNVRLGINLPTSNTAAVITISAIANQRIIIHNIQWSYSADPTGGNIKAAFGTGPTSKLDLDVTKGGPGVLCSTIFGAYGEQAVVTLAAGGSGITGKLSLQYSVSNA